MARTNFPNFEALADGRININTWKEYRGLKAEAKRVLDIKEELIAIKELLEAGRKDGIIIDGEAIIERLEKLLETQ